MKPDWKDAPEGAKYLAMDECGLWYWYASLPRWNGVEWTTSGNHWAAFDISAVNAGETLEERPQ